MPHHGTVQRVAAEGEIEVALGERELEGHAPLEPRLQLREQVAIDGVELDLLRPMHSLAGELAQQMERIPMRVDRNARRGLARLVQPRRVRRAELHPELQRAGEIAYGERRLVRLRDPARERDPLGVLEAVGDHPREQIFLRLGGLLRDTKRERLVDAAVDVRELDVEVVDRCGERHEPVLLAALPRLPRRVAWLDARLRSLRLARRPDRYFLAT